MQISALPISPRLLILFGALLVLLTAALTVVAALHGGAAPVLHPGAMHYNSTPGMSYS